MKKVTVPLCLCMFLGLCSFQQAPLLGKPTVEKSMPRVGAKQVWLETLETYALAGEWQQLGHIAKAAIEDGVSINRILKLAERIQVEPFLRALVATQNIRALSGRVGITKSELFRIALFIEAELDEARVSLNSDYLSRRKTGLERSIEYIPEANLLFIHLKDHGIDEVGRGVKKVVTKSILYDVENPEFAARCSSSYQMYNEMAALQLMQGAKGIVKLYACTERQRKDGAVVHNILCKLYRGGALSKSISNKKRFSFKQKMDVMSDLLEGLAAIHDKGLVHRDLTTRNVLLESSSRGEGKKPRMSAVIADFGRIKHIDSANGVKVQFNSRYLAPEGIIAERLSGEDYYATDLFALGCILHKLHFEKSGPWIDKTNLKNPTQPDAIKESKFIYDLKHYREVRLSKLILNRGYGTDLSTGDKVEHLILQLVHPEPAKRGTARAHAEAMQTIIKEFKDKTRATKINTPTPPEQSSEDSSDDESLHLSELVSSSNSGSASEDSGSHESSSTSGSSLSETGGLTLGTSFGSL